LFLYVYLYLCVSAFLQISISL
ncbi:putative transmembrane protein, partial [Toxoplasma gondii FOU]